MKRPAKKILPLVASYADMLAKIRQTRSHWTRTRNGWCTESILPAQYLARFSEDRRAEILAYSTKAEELKELQNVTAPKPIAPKKSSLDQLLSVWDELDRDEQQVVMNQMNWREA